MTHNDDCQYCAILSALSKKVAEDVDKKLTELATNTGSDEPHSASNENCPKESTR